MSSSDIEDLDLKTVEDYLNDVVYGDNKNYCPTDFALEFVTFIKLINGAEGEENETPVMHFNMLDTTAGKNPRIANLCARGTAKLQSGSSRVLTEYGWQTMQELEIGDSVVTRHGVLAPITYKTEPQYPKMYRMTLSDGTVLEVGDEHNHTVVLRQGGGTVERVMTTVELLERGLTYKTERKSIKDGKAYYRFRIPLIDPIQFSPKELPVHAYILGLAIANANYKGGHLSCHADDLEELMGTILGLGGMAQTPSIYGNAAGRFYIGKTLFKAYGDVTSRHKRIPPDALYGSIEQRAELLRGLMDGDGHIAKNGGCIYHTGSEGLAKDVQELVQGLGGIAKISCYVREEGRECYQIRMNVVLNPFKLKRKAEQWNPTKKRFKLITSIEEFECEEAGYCIMVGSEDHTYITEGYTVTHNTTLLGEYLFLYLAVYGDLPKFKNINLAIYVSDSIENGVKNMRKNLEYRWENSEFLRQYIPKTKFTDIRWEFNNIDGRKFIVKGYGAKTGVRGSKELGTRPQLAVLDDLISDEDARSETVRNAIEDTVYKAVNFALHPSKNVIIWSGTPFNAKDPLYKAVESGAWAVNVFPVCEQFPCSRKDFRSAWPDRFTFDYVKAQYELALKTGKIDTFNQEMMLRIMSDEDRLILDCDISWYKRNPVIQNKQRFNFYITTDFATGERDHNDFSVISVWAYNNNGDWLWVDGVCQRQTMDKNINDLFRLAQRYKPQSVGIEVSGQQGGFIPWIQEQMMVRNVWFPLASENNRGSPGVRPVPNTKKIERFNVVVPWFKMNKVFFPIERKDSPEIQQAINELSLVSRQGFKSKHDDFCSSGDTNIEELLPNGTIVSRRVDQLCNGSMVKGYDEASKTVTWVEVQGFLQTGVKQTYTVTDDDGNQIHLTGNHSVLTKRGWVRVDDLAITDKLVREKEKISLWARVLRFLR